MKLILVLFTLAAASAQSINTARPRIISPTRLAELQAKRTGTVAEQDQWIEFKNWVNSQCPLASMAADAARTTGIHSGYSRCMDKVALAWRIEPEAFADRVPAACSLIKKAVDREDGIPATGAWLFDTDTGITAANDVRWYTMSVAVGYDLLADQCDASVRRAYQRYAQRIHELRSCTTYNVQYNIASYADNGSGKYRITTDIWQPWVTGDKVFFTNTACPALNGKSLSITRVSDTVFDVTDATAPAYGTCSGGTVRLNMKTSTTTYGSCGASSMVNNQILGGYRQWIVSAMAAYDPMEYARANNTLENIWAETLRVGVPHFEDDTTGAAQYTGAGGSFNEGWNEYAIETAYIMLDAIGFFESGTDIDASASFPQLSDYLIRYFYRANSPMGQVGQYQLLYQPWPYRDHYADKRAGTPSANYYYVGWRRLMTTLWNHYSKNGMPTEASWAKYFADRWLPHQYPATGSSQDSVWNEFVFSMDPEAPAVDGRTALTTDHITPYMVLSRPNWTGDATWGGIYAQPEGGQHSHGDSGMFQIYRKGRWLTRGFPCYQEGLCLASDVKNGLTLAWRGTFNSPGGRNGISSSSTPSRVARKQNSTGPKALCTTEKCFAEMELTPTYAFSGDATIQNVRRHYVHIKPDAFVIADRIKYKPGISAQSVFNFFTEQPPTISGSTADVVVGDQAMRTVWVEPHEATPRVVAPSVQRIVGAVKINDYAVEVWTDTTKCCKNPMIISGASGNWAALNGTWTSYTTTEPGVPMAITAVTASPDGGYRITVSATHGWSTGEKVSIAQYGTPANPPTALGLHGKQYTITRISNTQFDLQGTTYDPSWTVGGRAGQVTTNASPFYGYYPTKGYTERHKIVSLTPEFASISSPWTAADVLTAETTVSRTTGGATWNSWSDPADSAPASPATMVMKDPRKTIVAQDFANEHNFMIVMQAGDQGFVPATVNRRSTPTMMAVDFEQHGHRYVVAFPKSTELALPLTFEVPAGSATAFVSGLVDGAVYKYSIDSITNTVTINSEAGSGISTTADDSGTIAFNTDGSSLPLEWEGPPGLPSGLIGQNYSQKMTCKGGNPPYAFSIDPEDLPSGTTLTQDGMLSGIPTVTGTYSFLARCSDTPSPDAEPPYTSQEATHPYTLTVTGSTGTILSMRTLATAGSHAVVHLGYPGLAHQVACSAETSLSSSMNPIQATVVSSHGPAYRTIVLKDAIGAGMPNYVRVQCGEEVASFTVTAPASVPPTTRILALTIPPIPGAERVEVNYGASPQLGTLAVQLCSGGCRMEVSVPSGEVVYLQRSYYGAGNQKIAESSVYGIGIP